MSQQPFEPSNYCIDYEALLINKEARKVFQEFLQENRNEEPLHFLDHYDEYSQQYETVLKEVFGGWTDEQQTSLKNSSNTSKQARNSFRIDIIGRVERIIDNFIEFQSEKELNIGTSQSLLLKYWKEVKGESIDVYFTLTGGNHSSSRLSFSFASDNQLSLSQLESVIMKKLHPDALFSKVLSSVHLDLKMDQFPRFVRSEKLRNFLKTKGETFTRSIGYDISKGYHVDLRFKPKDLKEQLITDNHIYFGFTLAQDTPDWKLIYEREDLYCYSSNSTYFFGESKGMKLLKSVMYFPFSLEDVSTMIFNAENHSSFDPQTKSFELHSYRPPSGLTDSELIGKSTYATQCLSIGIDLSLPLIKKRQLSSVATTIQETDLLFHLLHTADFSENEMSSQGSIKADSLSYYLFYRISNQFTRLVHVTYTNFDLPFQTNLLSEIFWKKRAKLLFKGFTKTLILEKKNVSDSNSGISDSHKHRQAIEDNKKVFPDRSWYKEWLELNKKVQ